MSEMADESEPWFPEGYGQDTADMICDLLADGLSLRAICKMDEMPSTSTVCKWLGFNAQFAEQYARARELQADALFDDCLDIADDDSCDLVSERDGDETIVRGNNVRVQRDKLRIDTRKWMAGKLKGKYSEKTVHEHGGIGGAPIQFGGLELTIVDPKTQA